MKILYFHILFYIIDMTFILNVFVMTINSYIMDMTFISCKLAKGFYHDIVSQQRNLEMAWRLSNHQDINLYHLNYWLPRVVALSNCHVISYLNTKIINVFVLATDTNRSFATSHYKEIR